MLATLAGSCSEPPDHEVQLAKTKTEAARAAGAEGLAPAAMAAVVTAQSALDAELKAQSTKWLRAYDTAGNLAVAVQRAADQATEQATGGRDRALAAAQAPGSDTMLGTNIFANGDFAKGTQAWFKHPDSDATISVLPVEGNQQAWHVVFRKGNWAVINQEQVLKPDTVYVYEGWVKSTAPLVAMYWQSDIGRHLDTDRAYPTWTRTRNVFVTPHWNGKPMRVSFCPVLMQGAGEAWLRDLRISEFPVR